MKITVRVYNLAGDIMPHFRTNNKPFQETRDMQFLFGLSDNFEENDYNEALNIIGRRAYDEAVKRGLKVNPKDFFDQD